MHVTRQPFLLALALFLAVLPVSDARADDRRGVTVFRDEAFRGGQETFHGDVADMGRTAVGNDRASSIVVARGCRVRVYEDTDFRGKRQDFNGDVSDLGRTAFGNDRVSSLKVRCGWDDDWGTEGPIDGHGYRDEGHHDDGYEDGYDEGGPRGPYGKPNVRPGSRAAGVVLYRDDRYRGRDARFAPGDYPDLRGTAVGNDAVSSVEVARGCRARLFEDTAFRGDYEEIDYDVPDLGATRIGNDRASSMQVRCGGGGNWGGHVRRGGVTLFEDARFEGQGERFEYDVPDLRDSLVGNDRASSIAVDQGCRVRLFEDVGYRGRSVELTRDEAYLGETLIGNDRVSSLEVRCRY